MKEKKKYGFVKMRKDQAILVLVYLGFIILGWCLTKPTILGISASQWVLCILAITFPIVNFIRMQMNKKKGSDDL